MMSPSTSLIFFRRRVGWLLEYRDGDRLVRRRFWTRRGCRRQAARWGRGAAFFQ